MDDIKFLEEFNRICDGRLCYEGSLQANNTGCSQKTGKWIPWKAYYGEDRKSWSDELKCSECGYKWGDEEYKFCPSCGARMEREEE